ncbi:probable mediator of RNA polymerase II transcription subunit 14 at N-terminal half [Coccomyxa sp. Obi]|nr:probable mediator of RNA polymerase II transcription subunit 14 at N-terminal half [Coccomyxa sp. Obi]
MGDQVALSGGLRLVDVRQILDVFLEQTSSQLGELSAHLGAQGDAERKRMLLLFLHNTKQRLLRLLIVVKWANKARVVAEVGRILDVAARQANACRDAADQLAYLHGELEDGRVPAYDVPTALEILQTGDYALLPSCIEELCPPSSPSPAVRRSRLRLMDQILRSTLLQEKLPAGVEVASIGGGVVELHCGKEWEARLTLVPAPTQPPKAPALQQDAAGGDGGGGQQHPSQDRAQESAGQAPASEGGNPTDAAKAEPMETDEPAVGTNPTEAGPSEERGGGVKAAGGVLDERWRWRLLSAKALPHFSGLAALMAPPQATQLQGAIEMRMWAASEAAEAEQSKESHPLEPVKPESGIDGPSTGSMLGAKTGVKAEAGLKGKSGAAGIAPRPRKRPLDILHGILRDVGGRLVLNEAVLWARSATKAPDGRWVRLLRIEQARLLPLGIRISYWLNVPTVTPADLQRLQQPEISSTTSKSTQQPPQHTPPAIEIGIANDGGPSVVACPELMHAISSDAEAGQLEGNVALTMDPVSLDTEEVVLRAAQANAAIQLAAIEALLRRSGNLQANNGAAALAAPAADGAASSGALPSPVMELSCDGQKLLSVRVQLRTGRLLLRAGNNGAATMSGSLGQELSPLLRQEEERLAALQAEALKQVPAEGLGSVGAAAADRLARALEALWLSLSVRARYSQLLSAAQHLGLHRAQLPAALLKEYAAANPLARLPAKNVLVLAFPPAPPMPVPPASPAGMQASGVSGQDHMDALLGKGGAGVQLYLQAEMCRGLQWRYGLVIAGCDARNMPVKVLQVLPVPGDLAAQKGTAMSGSQASTSAEALPSASGKRKRQDTESAASEAQQSGQQPGQATAKGGSSAGESVSGGGRAEAGGVKRMDAPDQAQWGLAHAAELGEVVRWAAPKIAWELLRLQLKALGISFTEEVSLAVPPTGASASLPNGQAAHRAASEKGVAEGAASGVLQRSLRLHGLHSLQLLNHANGVSGPTGVLLHMEPEAPLQKPSWTVSVQSAYFAGLPGSCCRCTELTPGGPEQHISQTAEGLTLAYSFATGGSVERAVADLRCLIRLHLALTRITVFMRSASGPPNGPPNASSNSAEGADPPKAHFIAAAKPLEQHSANMANGHAAEHGRGSSPDTDINGGLRASNSCAPLFWQAEEGSGIVSISAVGPSRAVLSVASSSEPRNQPNETANTGSDPGLHAMQQLQLSVKWAAVKPTPSAAGKDSSQRYGGSSPAEGRAMSGIQCRISATPELPASVLEAFADMADAGEEELLLDALSVCGCALAALAAALAPEALLDAGLLPEEVFLEPVVAPYKLRLRIARGMDAELALGMHLLAGGLVWLVPQSNQDRVRSELLDCLRSRLPEAFLPDAPTSLSSAHEAEESKGRGPQTAPSVLDSAMEIDGWSVPQQEATAGGSAMPAVSMGLWVRSTVFPAALQTALEAAAQML